MLSYQPHFAPLLSLLCFCLSELNWIWNFKILCVCIMYVCVCVYVCIIYSGNIWVHRKDSQRQRLELCHHKAWKPEDPEAGRGKQESSPPAFTEKENSCSLVVSSSPLHLFIIMVFWKTYFLFTHGIFDLRSLLKYSFCKKFSSYMKCILQHERLCPPFMIQPKYHVCSGVIFLGL